MLSLPCRGRVIPRSLHLHLQLRTLATTTQSPQAPCAEGNISTVFSSLSGNEPPPFSARFAAVKTLLVEKRQHELISSWSRVLSSLRLEIEHISSIGSAIIPTIDYIDIKNHSRVRGFENGLRKRGAAVIRGVVNEEEALGWKEEIREYLRKNPQTKAFPKSNPAVYELYWSPGQIKARAHRNVIETQRFLMSFWHKGKGNGHGDTDTLISTEIPVTYADRLRIQQPGDVVFALGPHVDGGSAERWEKEGYGKGGVYDRIFEGKWEDFDPWDASGRLHAASDLYNGAGACSMFRMFQGWLSMSRTCPGEGTLLVNPLFKLATTYYLLRPFFSPRNTNVGSSGYLDKGNWELDLIQSSVLQGATPGCTQELNDALHPHLELERTMIHIPKVRPGDYVAWHCDSIHAVDKVHAGQGDSSVLYIPACPLTKTNARYLVRQREAFLNGNPGPDFPGGKGESEHIGRMTVQDIGHAGGQDALGAMGLGKWNADLQADQEIRRIANQIIG